MSDKSMPPDSPDRFVPILLLPSLLAGSDSYLRSSPLFKKAERKLAWQKANPDKVRAARLRKMKRLMAQDDREALRKTKEALERARLAKE